MSVPPRLRLNEPPVGLLPDDGFVDLARIKGARPERAPYARAVAGLDELLRQVDAGRSIAAARWSAACDALAVPERPRPSPHRPDPVDQLPPVAELVRLTTDFAPAAGADAPPALLGPWSDTLDPRDPLERRCLMHAVAASAFQVHPEGRRTPVSGSDAEAGLPRGVERGRRAAITRAPFTFWRLSDHRGGDSWWVDELFGTGPRWRPNHPLDLSGASGVAGPPRRGGLLIARVVALEHGWQAFAPMVLPEVPPPALRERWLRLVSTRQLLRERGRYLEDVLASAGSRLCRRAHAWAWASVMNP